MIQHDSTWINEVKAEILNTKSSGDNTIACPGFRFSKEVLSLAALYKWHQTKSIGSIRLYSNDPSVIQHSQESKASPPWFLTSPSTNCSSELVINTTMSRITINRYPPPSNNINHRQPPSTTINHHQPPSTTINHHQPPSTTINHHQPPSTTINHHHHPVQPSSICKSYTSVCRITLSFMVGKLTQPARTRYLSK